tara:strand:- start:558 stop:695 length:138 start_codon:yes stop_codon:yes gene_type:complete
VEAANKITEITHSNWDTSDVLESAKVSLSKVTENKAFLNRVGEIE